MMCALANDAAAAVQHEKVFFFHLPKCGGTTIWSVLRDLSGGEPILQISSEALRRRFVTMTATERGSYRAIGGHFSLGLYRDRIDLSQYFCVTTFRDPVSRLISEYRYASRNQEHSHYGTISQLSLREFVERDRNPITRLICGRPDGSAAFATIREVFDRWAFVDEAGDFAALVAELGERAGKPGRPVAHLNAGFAFGPPPDVDRNVIAAIEQYHDADLELFRLLAEERASRTGRRRRARAPVFQVVTPIFNGAEYLDEAIESVVGQAGDFSIRYHIQDGGSTDATMAIIRRWHQRVQTGAFPLQCAGVQLTFDSRTDRGMYDAIALGFRKLAPARDDLMTWINADDRLAPGAMATVAEAFEDLPDIEFIGGRIALIDGRGKDLISGLLSAYPRRTIAAGLHDGRQLPFIQQEGTFWRARLWDRTGGIDTSFRHAGDWDLWRRFAAEAEYLVIDAVTGFHRRHLGQMTSDMTPYYREIADRTAKSAARDEPVRKDYLGWWKPNQRADADQFPTHIARRSATGDWQIIDAESPEPRGRPLTQLDGDWTVISGFDDPEGPFPDSGLTTPYRWMIDEPAALDLFSSVVGRRTVLLEMRGMSRGQKLEISVDGNSPVRRRLRGRFPKPEKLRIKHDFKSGPSRLMIRADHWLESAEGRRLGVMLSAVRFQDASSRHPWLRRLFQRLIAAF